MYVCVCIGWIVTTRFRLYQRAPMAVSPMHKLSCTGDCCFWVVVKGSFLEENTHHRTPYKFSSNEICLGLYHMLLLLIFIWWPLTSPFARYSSKGWWRLANSPHVMMVGHWMAMGYPLWMGIWMGTSSKSHGSWFSYIFLMEIAWNSHQ